MEHLQGDVDSLASQSTGDGLTLSLASPPDTNRNTDDLGSLTGEGSGDGVLSEAGDKGFPQLIIQERLQDDSPTSHPISVEGRPVFTDRKENENISLELICEDEGKVDFRVGQVDTSIAEESRDTGQTGYLVYNPADRTFSVATPDVTPVLVLAKNGDQGMFEANVVLDRGGGLSQLLKLQGLQTLSKANMVIATEEDPQNGLPDPTTITLTRDDQDQALSEKDNSSGGLLYVCHLDGCTAGFPTVEALQHHHSTHDSHKGLRCPVKGCGRKFAWPAHLKYHQLTHTGQRLYCCEVEGCNASFYTAQRLTVHRRIHTGEKPFVCQVSGCNKSFTTQGNLKNHQRIHSGERPFVCKVPLCGRRFAEQSSLRKHSLVHTGEKPFLCDVCGKTFQQSSSRKVHLKRHLNGKDETLLKTVADQKSRKQCQIEGEQQNVLVLRQAEEDLIQYQDIQGAESVVFSNVATDHVVTVTTQPSDNEVDHLDLTRGMLTTEELPQQEAISSESPMHGPTTGANVVVLSQPEEMVSIAHGYHHSQAGSHEEIVYNSHLLHVDLDHEEIAHNLTGSDQPQPDETSMGQHEPAEETSSGSMMEVMLDNISAT